MLALFLVSFWERTLAAPMIPSKAWLTGIGQVLPLDSLLTTQPNPIIASSGQGQEELSHRCNHSRWSVDEQVMSCVGHFDNLDMRPVLSKLLNLLSTTPVRLFGQRVKTQLSALIELTNPRLIQVDGEQHLGRMGDLGLEV